MYQKILQTGLIWSAWHKVPETRYDWFVSKQIKSFYSQSTTIFVGTILLTLTMAAVALVMGFKWPQGVALLAYGAWSLQRVLRAKRINRQGISNINLYAEIAWIKRHGLQGGLIFAVTATLTLILPGQEQPGFAALLIIASIFVGSWSIDMVPGAAMRYLIVSVIGFAIGFTLVGSLIAFVTFGIILLYSVGLIAHARISYNSFAVRLYRAKTVEESAETVQLLLNDYEEHGADWLWEISADGLIANPSVRFVESAMQEGERLCQTALIDLFDEGHERAILSGLIEKGQSFRDVIVSLKLGGEEHWWALSGRAIIDANGEFSGMRGVATDVSAAKRAEAKVAYMAHYDSLTDLPNRMLFNESLGRALSRRHGEKPLAVLYIDLDHFKIINDTLGHNVGDEVLRVAAKRIESCLGLHDMVARIGGDEFVILLTDISGQADAEAVATAIVAAMDSPILVDNQEVCSGASVGIAIAPGDGLTALDLIKNADLALYHAKENGRHRHAMFEIGMHEVMQAKRLIEVDLRSALSRDQLELYYQPLLNIESGEISSYEALLRWHHPEEGMILPAVFIPIAEENGHIVQLGEWVIRTALMEVARWPEHLSVSVNVSPAQMRSTNLLPTVINALAASGVDASRLEIEITETVLMRDTQANLAVLHQLHALGVRIALDDFGTGYSSLNYLRSFPFDKIKIDRCFVDEVDSRDDSRAIVRAVTGLAASLGIITTAEGVEREDQLIELKREGCTEVQGYLFSRPIPVENIKDRMAIIARPSKIAALDLEHEIGITTANKQRRVG